MIPILTICGKRGQIKKNKQNKQSKSPISSRQNSGEEDSHEQAMSQALLQWYQQNRRDLPWRKTKDPYRILVSEIMSQQTQIDRVLKFYQRWMQHLPTEHDVAQADRETVQRFMEGAGYPSRADRLQAACREIVDQRDGQWPHDVREWLDLPGVGPYTAAAVSCFARGASGGRG